MNDGDDGEEAGGMTEVTEKIERNHFELLLLWQRDAFWGGCTGEDVWHQARSGPTTGPPL